jgi:secreted Zn-dependent insulinase-like peptidase
MKGIWWPVFEKMKFLDDITHKQIIDFSILFRLHLTLDMLVAGNMTAEVIQHFFVILNRKMKTCNSYSIDFRLESS